MQAPLDPVRLWSRTEILRQKPYPVPKESGIYAWYFKKTPPNVPTQDCHRVNNFTLLYVGISPRNSESSGNIRKRIRQHLQGNAEGSTLRKSFG
jgi:GIY-YIG catalytic domain